ncbi:MAG: glycerol dehydrogenase [Spirochaetota bacterium]|nr:glycerol dehydrogenase [Spirochaetota bacterium]
MRKAFISPTKYIQCEDALKYLGDYVKLYGESALLIAHKDDIARVKEQLDFTASEYKIKFVMGEFGGECSREEVKRLLDVATKNNCDCIVGLGGGKAIDTCKCVGDSKKPIIICPTIAATDAPTSSSAVLYTPDGAFDDYAYFRNNPEIVLVDTTVISKAPVRFLVSGMGDALSTYFEARSTTASYGRVNASGYNKPKAVGTMTAMALAELCYETLLEEGVKAKIACEAKAITPALEKIIETNILLSGLGFESGGLAAAHAVHNGLTVFPEAHKFYHGEKVAFGTIVHLVLENADLDEIGEVIEFCLSVGLPVCLADLGIKKVDPALLKECAQKSTIPEESVHNMPFPVTADMVEAAILVADKLGSEARGGGTAAK